MKTLKKTALCVAIIAATATSALATDTVIDPANKIQIQNVYDNTLGGTVPGVLVTSNGTKTLYQVGNAPGLTADVVFDESGKKAEAWARDHLGIEVDALKCGGGGKETAGGGGGWSFTNC